MQVGVYVMPGGKGQPDIEKGDAAAVLLRCKSPCHGKTHLTY